MIDHIGLVYESIPTLCAFHPRSLFITKTLNSTAEYKEEDNLTGRQTLMKTISQEDRLK